jgi:hypothetical protein
VTLKNGKRVDSYNKTKGEIIERKAIDFDDIDSANFEAMLDNTIEKYPIGEPINAPKYRNELKGEVLQGRYILEVPDTNIGSESQQLFTDIASRKGFEISYVPE